MDYRWVQTGTLKTEAPIRALSWNLEGTRLLTAGSLVQLWHLKSMPVEEEPVVFTLGGNDPINDGSDSSEPLDEQDKPQGTK